MTEFEKMRREEFYDFTSEECLASYYRTKQHEVRYPKAGDFLIDRKYLFEVGGKGKTFDQIKDISDSYLGVDNTEIGHKNRIPLWMFGLLY